MSQKRYKIEIYFQRKTNMKSYVTYGMASMSVTLNDLEGQLPVTGLFKCILSDICAYPGLGVSSGVYVVCINRDILSSKNRRAETRMADIRGEVLGSGTASIHLLQLEGPMSIVSSPQRGLW